MINIRLTLHFRISQRQGRKHIRADDLAIRYVVVIGIASLMTPDGSDKLSAHTRRYDRCSVCAGSPFRHGRNATGLT